MPGYGKPAVACAFARLSPARNVEQRAGAVGRLVRQQPKNGARDLFGIAAALHRDGGFQPLDAVGLAAAGVDLGMDQARAHRIDADALPSAATSLARPRVKVSIAPLAAA